MIRSLETFLAVLSVFFALPALGQTLLVRDDLPLAWTPAKNATSYDLWRCATTDPALCDDRARAWRLIAEGLPDPRYTDTAAPPRLHHVYRVVAHGTKTEPAQWTGEPSDPWALVYPRTVDPTRDRVIGTPDVGEWRSQIGLTHGCAYDAAGRLVAGGCPARVGGR